MFLFAILIFSTTFVASTQGAAPNTHRSDPRRASQSDNDGVVSVIGTWMRDVPTAHLYESPLKRVIEGLSGPTLSLWKRQTATLLAFAVLGYCIGGRIGALVLAYVYFKADQHGVATAKRMYAKRTERAAKRD